MDADSSHKRRFMRTNEGKCSINQIHCHQKGTDDREVQALCTERRDPIHSNKSKQVPWQLVLMQAFRIVKRQEAWATGRKWSQED